MFKMSSFCLHTSPEALALLCNSIVDNPLIIHSLPHTRLHSSHLWPLNSPHLKPVHYKVWSVVQEQVCHTPILTVNDLKQGLLVVWAALYKRIIYYFLNVHFGR